MPGPLQHLTPLVRRSLAEHDPGDDSSSRTASRSSWPRPSRRTASLPAGVIANSTISTVPVQGSRVPTPTLIAAPVTASVAATRAGHPAAWSDR